MGGGSSKSIALIPAYKPSLELINITNSLLKNNIITIVVNDGSGKSFDDIFLQLDKKVIVLNNAVNLGKGAALKHGINYILNNYKNAESIITLDCDGQHKIQDVLNLKDKFASNKNIDLAIGVRTFDSKVPFRSNIGNKTTKAIFKIMFGRKILDTQSGLRIFSLDFAKLILSIPYNGYEFEMQMLILACNKNKTILQVPITTIYINNNASSHFNPIFDSLSIYFVLFRHTGNSIITAAIDYIVFVIAFYLGYSLLSCMIAGRIVAGSFNFFVGKILVFKTKANLKFEIISYIVLTIILMLLSMQSISILSHYSGISEVVIKPFCELAIFAISFLVQRFFIFTTKNDIMGGGKKLDEKATDWESYYSANTRKVHISSITRKISQMIILGLLQKYLQQDKVSRICEFGGGDSCFYEGFRKIYNKAYYKVLDNSTKGVDLFNNKYKNTPPFLQDAQICNLLIDLPKAELTFDIVFSAGLIEHFDKYHTQTMIKRHFDFTKDNGIVLITYPTPTLLYRIIRKFAEILKVWKFHDERALFFDEVHDSAKEYGELLARKLNFAIGLTQEVLVYKKIKENK